MSSSRRHFGLAAVAAAAALTASSDADALPLLQLSGNVRGVYVVDLGAEGRDLSSAGFGLSAGLTLPMSLYLGASFQYFVGTDRRVTYTGSGGSARVLEQRSPSSAQLLAHVGYDIGLIVLTLRPSVGLGWWDAKSNFDGFAFSPGVEVLYSFGLLNVSAEARFNTVAHSSGGSTQSTILGLGAGFSL